LAIAELICFQSAIGNRKSAISGAPMFLARVTGHVVATQKDKTLSGQKLFVVEPLNVKYDEASKPASLGNTGRAIVAIDVVGCGEGQLVLVCQGSSARMTEQTKNLPADAVIIGIVDTATFDGKTFYQSN
jgi:ethanolamine utilization protein EutN